MLLEILFVLGWVWFIVLARFLHKLIFVKLKYTEHLDPNIKEEHKPFQRLDRKNWNFYKFLITGYFLIPIRICLCLFAVSTVNVWVKVMGFVKKNNHNYEYPKWKLFIVQPFQKLAAYFIHFSFGFHWVRSVKLNIADFDPSYKHPANPKEYAHQAPIQISNHVSWVDIMVLIASEKCPSFLSKKAVASYPLYGANTTSLQSIYLDRESEENRNQATEMIKERCELIKNKKRFNSLHIFPEGTTSSGSHLISFKKGAFQPLVPIEIICLKYDFGSFHPAIDIGQLETIVLQLCQLQNNCTMYKLGTYYPEGNLKFNGDENDWKIYADKVKSIMSKCLNIPTSEAGYRDMKEYEKLTKEYNKQLLTEAKNKKQK